MMDKEKIAELFKTYAVAFRKKDPEACGECYTRNAEYIACGMAPLHGRAAIVRLHREIFEAGYKLDSMATDEVRVSGDLAYVRQTMKVSGATTHVMIVMQCDAKGRWLVSAEAEVTAA